MGTVGISGVVILLVLAVVQRIELRECDLTDIRGTEALRGARMAWNDVLANAVTFASVVGIEIVD